MIERVEPWAVVSHELRTPLQAIAGLARVLGQTELDVRQRAIVTALQANAELGLQLANGLLDGHHLQRMPREPEVRLFRFAEMLQALDGLFGLAASQKRITLVWHDKTGGSLLRGDSLRLQQILANLVGNALKFTAQGGIEVAGEVDSDQLIVRVRDTGLGIPPDKLTTIFDPFVQIGAEAPAQGVGLGLAIAGDMARFLGGRLGVESREGVGSVFTLEIPVGIEKIPEEAGREAAGMVLVVDDYPANALVLTLTLENLGFAAKVAASGAEALRQVRQSPQPLKAILMDLRLPDMDGAEATRQIRASGFQGTILGVTAHADKDERERCRQAGMDEVVEKPVAPETLRALITRSDGSSAKRSATA